MSSRLTVIAFIFSTALALFCLAPFSSAGERSMVACHLAECAPIAGLSHLACLLLDRLAPLPDDVVARARLEAHREYTFERKITCTELVRGNTHLRDVALTFDDGPHPGFTPRLLALLAKEKVTATFFVVGKEVMRDPGLIQEEAAAGHEVANHTYHHIRLNTLRPDLAIAEMKEGVDAIDQVLGSPTRIIRPPGGEYTPALLKAVRKAHFVTVLWTDDAADYLRPSPALIEHRILESVSNGSVILLHDGIEQTLEALPTIIETLRRRGFHFVTVSQMASQPGIHITEIPQVKKWTGLPPGWR